MKIVCTVLLYFNGVNINEGYCVVFAVDDLVKNYRQAILKTVKRHRTNPRSRPKLHPPVDILNIDAKVFAEQLTYIDAVSITNALQYLSTFELADFALALLFCSSCLDVNCTFFCSASLSVNIFDKIFFQTSRLCHYYFNWQHSLF